MECPICLEKTDDMYTIECGSKTPHQICNSCEISMRFSATLTHRGRFIKCPMCRAVETVQGKRTIHSYQAELQRMYAQTLINPRVPSVTIIGPRLVVNLGHRILSAVMPNDMIPMVQMMPPHQLDLLAQNFAQRFPAPVPTSAPAPVPTSRIWCQSGRRNTGQCPTKSKTKRFCSFENCLQRVCRTCQQCINHL